MLLSNAEQEQIKQEKPSRICPHTGKPCVYAPKPRKTKQSKKAKLDAFGHPIPILDGPKLTGGKNDWGKIVEWIKTHPKWKVGNDWAFVDAFGKESKDRPPILYYSYVELERNRCWNWVLGDDRIRDIRMNAPVIYPVGYCEYGSFREWEASQKEMKDG